MKKAGRHIIKGAVIITLTGIIAFAGTVGYICIREGSVPKAVPEEASYDAIIVLGAQVKPDGSPSVQLGWRLDAAYEAYSALSESIVKVEEEDDLVKKADTYKDVIKSQMEALRASCDKLETETAAEFWPFPTYGELLFAVR